MRRRNKLSGAQRRVLRAAYRDTVERGGRYYWPAWGSTSRRIAAKLVKRGYLAGGSWAIFRLTDKGHKAVRP